MICTTSKGKEYLKNYMDEFSQLEYLYNNIGCSAYEYVKGSKIYQVSLRHYATPQCVKSNGKIIYMTTPLINKPELFDLTSGKSVIQALLKKVYIIYMVDHGDPGREETEFGLDFMGKLFLIFIST